jgi:uncharacterized tellurite resistance protein B-like protein
MLAGFKSFFSDLLQAEQEVIDTMDPKQLAAAALMIEVATIDEDFDDKETAALTAELRRQFELDNATLHTLVERARAERNDATSLYQFTRLVNDAFTAEEKCLLLLGMWRVAFADGNLNKYEEHIIRRVSELIYVPHTDFIRTKKAAKNMSV